MSRPMPGPIAQRPPEPGHSTWLHMYNHHRHHTAIGGPPICRVNNVVGSHS